MFEIDGDHGEGGGDVIRFGLGYSVISGLPVRINNIRARRTHPGLQLHHLSTVKILGALCDAKLMNAEKGSQELTFIPQGEIRGGEYFFDVDDSDEHLNSGTIAPIIKAVIIPLAFSKNDSLAVFRGATDSTFSIPLARIQRVLLPTLKRMGIDAELRVKKRSWYPFDGGEVEVMVKGGVSKDKLAGMMLSDRGVLKALNFEFVIDDKLPESLKKMIVEAIRYFELGNFTELIKFNWTEVERTVSGEIGIFLFAEYEDIIVGFEKFGDSRDFRSILKHIVDEFIRFHSSVATTDRYLADQLILPCVLANGDSAWVTSTVTDHLVTNIWLGRTWMGANIDLRGTINELGYVYVHKTRRV